MLNYETFHDDSNYFLKLYDCTFNYYKEKICEKYINFQQLFRWFVQKGWNKCFPFLNLENIYLLAVDHRNTRKRRGISSKLTIKTLQRRPAVFTVSFVHIFHLFPVFLLLTLNRKMFAGWYSLREKCPYQSYSGPHFPAFGLNMGISPYSVQMRKNEDQNNSEYGHFSRSEYDSQIGHVFSLMWLDCSDFKNTHSFETFSQDRCCLIAGYHFLMPINIRSLNSFRNVRFT